MFHKKRVWVVSAISSAEELARKVTEGTYCLCNGFELNGYWFLNDATHEDGAQEYAVVKRDGPDGRPLQVESITMSWCSYENALDHIRRAIAGEFDAADYAVSVDPVVQSPGQHGRCPHCA